MQNLDISCPEINYSFPMIFVQGTGNATYLFGAEEKLKVHLKDFYISKYPVAQILWEYIMGTNPTNFKGQYKPVESVSFNDITFENGFIDKLNAFYNNDRLEEKVIFRLPSETEWEYAARGGIHWKDDFLFSGSNNIEEVGWSGDKHSRTETHVVGEKLPNQLGIHDMCGNVWEWCQDYFQRDIHLIPNDGTPCLIETNDRVLRGGCHHNGAVHCTISKRYEIFPAHKDECIGFRIAAMPV